MSLSHSLQQFMSVIFRDEKNDDIINNYLYMKKLVKKS